jgi:hypothetical protein
MIVTLVPYYEGEIVTWWKTASNAYVNSKNVKSVYVTGADTTWTITAWFGNPIEGDDDLPLFGTWTSEAAALEAMQKLVQGFNPADL